MRNKILFTLTALLLMATGMRAQTPYAVYASSNKTLTFKYDENKPTDGTKVYELNEGKNVPGWLTHKSDITKVVFEKSFQKASPTTCHKWFYEFKNLTTIEGLENLNTSNVTDMSSMFSYCEKLTSLDLSNFNTSNVTDMSLMFGECSKLTLLALSNFNTENVKYIGGMFSECHSLKSLDLSKFNTSNVTDIGNMFGGCESLESLDLSKFNTSNVTNMSFMFGGCSKLTSLDLSSFNTEKVTNMGYMFYGCRGLTSLDLSNFNTANVTIMTAMFADCSNLRLLDLSKATIDFSKIESESKITENVLIYVPEGTTVTANRKNVVVGSTCKHFVLDGSNNQLLLNVPYGFTAEQVTVNREFTADTPYTLYLPFAMNATDYGTFYTYSGYDANKVTFSKLTDEQTTANTPYLFKPEQNYADGIVIERESGITVETTPEETVEPDESGLCGVYAKKTFTAAEANERIYYGWASGEFKRAGEGAKVDACRAYLKLPASDASNAPARLSVKFEDENTTGIINIEREDSGTESPIYNLNGQRVGNSYRGVVIKNGKKIVNRAQ